MRELPPTLTISPPSCISSLRRRVLSQKQTTTCTPPGTPPRCSTTSRSLEFAETDTFSKCAYDNCHERTTKERRPLEGKHSDISTRTCTNICKSIPLNSMYALQRICLIASNCVVKTRLVSALRQRLFRTCVIFAAAVPVLNQFVFRDTAYSSAGVPSSSSRTRQLCIRLYISSKYMVDVLPGL